MKGMKKGFDNRIGYNAKGNSPKVVKSVLGDAAVSKDRNLPHLGGNNSPIPGGNAVAGKNRTGYNKMPG